jgi:VanZ family protein
MPGRDVPHISFLEMLSFDKWVHASIFFVLTLLLAKAIHLSNNQSTLYLLIATATALVYGGALEIMQGLVFEERSADVYDFIANSMGAILACFFYKKMDTFVLSKWYGKF